MVTCTYLLHAESSSGRDDGSYPKPSNDAAHPRPPSLAKLSATTKVYNMAAYENRQKWPFWPPATAPIY